MHIKAEPDNTQYERVSCSQGRVCSAYIHRPHSCAGLRKSVLGMGVGRDWIPAIRYRNNKQVTGDYFTSIQAVGFTQY